MSESEGTFDFKVGDTVIAVRDGRKPRFAYDTGDIGIVEEVDHCEDIMTVRFDTGVTQKECYMGKFDRIAKGTTKEHKVWARRAR